jgi:hypothetical protein
MVFYNTLSDFSALASFESSSQQVRYHTMPDSVRKRFIYSPKVPWHWELMHRQSRPFSAGTLLSLRRSRSVAYPYSKKKSWQVLTRMLVPSMRRKSRSSWIRFAGPSRLLRDTSGPHKSDPSLKTSASHRDVRTLVDNGIAFVQPARWVKLCALCCPRDP